MKANIVIPQGSGRHETLFSVNLEQIPPVDAILSFPGRKRVLRVMKQVWVFGAADKLHSVELHCRAPGGLENPLYPEQA